MKQKNTLIVRVMTIALILIGLAAVSGLCEELFFTQGKNLTLLEQDGITILLNSQQPEYEGDDYIRLGATVHNDTDQSVIVRYTMQLDGVDVPVDDFYQDYTVLRHADAALRQNRGARSRRVNHRVRLDGVT